MKRQMKNDRVVKAITIGISAMMAITSTPVSVFADELSEVPNEPGDGATSTDETVESQNEVSVQAVCDASEAAGEAVADVVTTIENVADVIAPAESVPESSESGQSESESSETETGNLESTYVAEVMAANEDLANTVFGDANVSDVEVIEGVEAGTDDNGTGSDVVDAVADAEIYTAQLPGDQVALDNEAQSVDDTCKSVVEKAGELNIMAHAANEAIEKSVSDIQEKSEAIVNADSVEVAKINLDSVEVIAASAQADYEAAKDNYDSKLSELNDAKLEAAKAQEEYANAYDKYEQDIEAAEAEWEEATEKLATLETALNNVESLTKEEIESLNDKRSRLEALLEKASAEKESAQTKLEEAQKAKSAAEEALKKAQEADDEAKAALEEANKAVEEATGALNSAQSGLTADQNAYKKLNSSKDMAEKIAYMESQRAADEKDNWAELDKLFATIVENYYIANVYAPGATNVKIQKVNGSYFTKDADSAKNYCTVTYMLDGVKQSAYFNYKREPGTNQIIIFEKTLELVKEESYDILDADGNTLFTVDKSNIDKALGEGEKLNNSCTQFEYSYKDADGASKSATLIKVGDAFYMLGGEMETSTTAYDDKTENGYDKYQVGSEDNVSYEIVDGKLVKTIKRDVAEITYENSTISTADSKSTDKSSVEKAMNDKKAELESAGNKSVELSLKESTAVRVEREDTVNVNQNIDLSGVIATVGDMGATVISNINNAISGLTAYIQGLFNDNGLKAENVNVSNNVIAKNVENINDSDAYRIKDGSISISYSTKFDITGESEDRNYGQAKKNAEENIKDNILAAQAAIANTISSISESIVNFIKEQLANNEGAFSELDGVSVNQPGSVNQHFTAGHAIVEKGKIAKYYYEGTYISANVGEAQSLEVNSTKWDAILANKNDAKYTPTGNGTYEAYAQNGNTDRVFFEFETLDDNKKSSNAGDDLFAEWMKDARNKVKALLESIANKEADVEQKQSDLNSATTDATAKMEAQAGTSSALQSATEDNEAKGKDRTSAQTAFDKATQDVTDTQKSVDATIAKIEDYTKKETAYITALGKVEIAKNAVEEAKDKLDKLRSQLQKLERNDVVSADIINKLQLAVDDASRLMEEAQNNKEKAEQEAQKARDNYKEAVDRINREIAEKEEAEKEQTEKEDAEEEQTEKEKAETEQTEKEEAEEEKSEVDKTEQVADGVVSAIDNTLAENAEDMIFEDGMMYASVETSTGEGFAGAIESGDAGVAAVAPIADDIISDGMLDLQGLDAGVAGVRRGEMEASGTLEGELEHDAGVAGVRRDLEEGFKKAEVKEDDGVKKIKTGDIVTIEDEETPLAATPFEEEKNNMNWWWLLVVAILGTTGYEMYKKHKEKKAIKLEADKHSED